MRFKDYIKIGSSEDLVKHLTKLARDLRGVSEDIETRLPRSNDSVAMSRLNLRAAVEVERLRDSLPNSTDSLAWAMRNIFEINLISKYIRKDDEKMKNWLGQMAGDNLQILEGAVKWAEPGSEEVAAAKAQIEHLREIFTRNGIVSTDPVSAGKMAKFVGMQNEYETMFKLSSKFIHPSSFIVNSSVPVGEYHQYLELFILKGQFYALNILQESREWLEARVSS